MTDEQYMQYALTLAEKGAGYVNPNPLVGAVLVKNNRIIGEGYHTKFGALHAEREALAHTTESPLGATLYVTLEPCCHTGKTPPCTDAIIAAKIARVVIGMKDPNPLVAGKGIAALENAGISVTTGIFEDACHLQNAFFIHFITSKTPFIIMKYAMTLDGKIATYTGHSKWITGETARKHVHKTRARVAAILVGIGTVLADDPSLTARLPNAHQPTRIVCDAHLRLPLDSQLVQTSHISPVLIATTVQDTHLHQAYLDHGCDIVVIPARKDGEIDLSLLLKILGDKNIDSVLVEGGSTIHGSFLDDKLVHQVQAYIAPKLFGGKTAPSPINGCGALRADTGVLLRNIRYTPLGNDLLIEGEVH